MLCRYAHGVDLSIVDKNAGASVFKLRAESQNLFIFPAYAV
jgi:hypothetical protein